MTLILFAYLLADSPRGIVSWDHSGRDVLGNKETIAEVEYALAVAGTDPDKEAIRRKRVSLGGDWRKRLRDHGVPVVTIRQLERHYRADLVRDLQAMPLETAEYRIWVRVSDDSGNWSLWSGSSPVLIVDTVPPEPPTAVEWLP